jgi:hypothetical protein
VYAAAALRKALSPADVAPQFGGVWIIPRHAGYASLSPTVGEIVTSSPDGFRLWHTTVPRLVRFALLK